MKNLFNSFVAIAVTCTLLSCNHNEPEPAAAKPLPQMADVPEKSARIADPNSGDKDTQIQYGLSWQLVKTGILYSGESLSFKRPFSIGNYRGGDVTWKVYEGAWSMLEPTNVKFLNLGQFVNRKTITQEYLDTNTFAAYNINSSHNGFPSWPLQMTTHSTIACKTADGKYFLLEMKQVTDMESIEVNLYQGVTVVIP
jgi:hypothetical protein